MSDNITLPREVVQDALDALEWAWGCEHMRAKKREAITALRTALAAEPTKQEPGLMEGLTELARQMKPLDADMAAILHDNLDSLYIEDEPALAADPPKPEPVAYFDLQKQVFYWARPTMIDVPMTVALEPLALYTAPPAIHPGYVIGSHWLETAYSRICAGEAEADVLRDCGWERVDDIEALRRDAEQGRWLRDWLDNNGLLIRAIRGESLAGYEHPDIEALRRDAERLREAVEAYIRAKDSDGGGKGGFFPKPPTVAHQRRVHLAWQELNAALRREETT